MLTIHNMKHMTWNGETSIAYYELFADTVSDLPDDLYYFSSPEKGQYKIAQGSICYVVDTGEMYMVRSDGTWVVQDNSGGGSAVLIEKSITENGTYVATSDNADGYSSVTVNVSGSSSSDPINDVNFYDYDGTIVKSYSASDFANLSALPENPSHTGLTAQGWNWTLADAKTHVASYNELNIGQMYTTSDGKTRIYIKLTEGRISPILMLYLNNNSELDIDWGDDSAHSTFTSTSADYKSERHNYALAGEYVIAITVVSGSFVIQSQSTSYNTFFTDGRNNVLSSDRVYLNSIQKIEIGTGITSIGQYAFSYCTALSSITIPDTVTSIGICAFQNCFSLASIAIPYTVTSIESAVFYYCYSLSSITIPDGVTSIKNTAFSSCYALTSVTIPDGVTSIEQHAFNSCNSLSSIAIPDTVTSIGIYVFKNCSALASVTIPDTVTSIGQYTFDSCSALASVTIPDGVTSIGQYAFQNCSALSSITIPDTVTSIGTKAFYNCSYLDYARFEKTTPITISNSNVFSGWSATITTIYVPAQSLIAYRTATNYPNPSTFRYVGFATYALGETLPTSSGDPEYTLTWYATSADAIAQTNPITQGTGNEVYSVATPVV